jgi:hypothetical protein
VRADFTLTLDDSVKLPARVQVALFVLDSTYDVIAAVIDTMSVEAAKPVGTLSVRARPPRPRTASRQWSWARASPTARATHYR